MKLTSQHVRPKDLIHVARSFHVAAKTLARESEAALPVLNLYRHAVELHLKAIVLWAGGNFLEQRPDPISVMESHSVSWLAQFVVRTVVAAKLNDERWSPAWTRCSTS